MPTVPTAPPPAAIDLKKSVYLGHDDGASCPGLKKLIEEETSPITYCFIVTNTGETYLNSITITDTTLGITEQALTLISGTQPLAPGASLVYYFEDTLDKQLTNIAITEGNPTDSQGNDLPGYSNPTDQDSAEVDLSPRADPETDEPGAPKKIFMPLVVR